MYPFLDIFGIQLHMTGIGIIVFVLVFLWASRRYARHYELNRTGFWTYLPIYAIFIYFVSQYTWYLIGDFVIFPTSWYQLLSYISPAWYTFHLVGIVIALWLCVRHFFSVVTDPHKQVRWIDTWFLSMMRACIPLGLFLLLGDNFIGQPSEANIVVSSFHPDSNMARYDTVIPLGMYLSLISLLLLMITKILRVKKPNIRWYGIIWWIVFLLLACLLLLFQVYPRHLVALFVKTRDIKNYTLLAAVLVIVRKYIREYHFYTQLK